jgi:aspartoacylase
LIAKRAVKANFMNSIKRINSVAIVGGTHGNELTGVHLVKNWQKRQRVKNYSGFQVELLLANPAAIDANKRYLQKDLNRCFKLSELADSKANLTEQLLAKQINQSLGPKGDARVDFIIDLHTSTANMRTNIVLIRMDDFHLKLAAYIKSVIPEVVVTSESKLMSDHHFLSSIADKSLLIEVGPVPQGATDARVFAKTSAALEAALKFVELFNADALPPLNEELEVMSYIGKVYFPTDESGEMCAMVHPNLLHQDFSMLKTGESIFQDFSGNDIAYDGVDAHIAFVNEAAYYDQKIAMCLCNPITYSIKTLKPVLQP